VPLDSAIVRDVPEPSFSGWEPPGYRVDESGKVVGVTPGEPNNWGRFGEFDQIGTANLLTPERVARAARLVRTGKRFSLALPIGVPTPGSYRAEPTHLYRFAAGDSVVGAGRGGARYQVSDDYIFMALQASTQVDGFGHVGGDGALYNGFWAGLVTATGGAKRLGIHHLARGIVGRAVLLDVARSMGVAHLEPGFPVGPDELDRAAHAHGVAIEAGDVVLVRTGHLGRKIAQAPDDPASRSREEPGISTRAIPWLHEHDVAMIATDTAACSVVPPEPGDEFLTWHVAALRDLGLLVGELFDLDELADDCAQDHVYDGMFVAAPMPIVGASGSPLNPIVLK
jgi:kynurenine formamidase